MQRISLREAVRNKILNNLIGRARGGTKEEITSKKFILVLDTRATRVLNATLLSHDLAEEGVAITENLQLPRQPFRALEAIYIIEPTQENLERIANDFADYDRPLYYKAHVFMTGQPHTQGERLAVSNLYDRCRGIPKKNQHEKNPSRLVNLLEANIDFLAIEDHAFHLDLPKALVQLFGPNEEQAVFCQTRIVDGLASLCTTLNEFPYIRFANENAFSQEICKELSSRIDAIIGEDKFYKYHGDGGSNQSRATVLFLDRRFDLATPLLHEFSYQALVYDLLQTRDNLVIYGTETDQRALLNESDPLWLQFRHVHVSIVTNRLITMLRELSQTAVGEFQQKSAENISLEEMNQVMNEIPLFKEIAARHAIHMAVMQACMDKVAKESMFETSNLEQTIVSGVDNVGERMSDTKIMNELAGLMRRTEVKPEDKLRVACLHAVTLGQVSQDVCLKFIRDANLPLEAQDAFLGLSQLGIRLLSSGSSGAGAGGSWRTWRSSKMLNMQSSPEEETIYRNPETMARVMKTAKAASQQSGLRPNRFTPIVKGYAEQICTYRMLMDNFPFVKDPPIGSGEGGIPLDTNGPAFRVTQVDRSLSVRKHAANTENIAVTRIEKVIEGETQKIVYQGGRIIIFIAGGMTHSELRELAEVMKQSSRGSTHILTPQNFLQSLEYLGDDKKAEEYLKKEIDLQQEARAVYADTNNNGLFTNEVDPSLLPLEEDPDDIALRNKLQAEEQLGFIPMIVSYIPFCGKPIAAWLNGEDDDELDEGVFGLGLFSNACCSCFKKKNTSQPLASQGQPI